MDSKLSPEDKLYSTGAATDENFFDTSDVASPEYDNGVNHDTVFDASLTAEEREQKRQEYQQELAKLDDEILTLRQVLSSKVRQAGELKRKLGITPMVELKTDLSQGLQNIKESNAYQKTNETLHKGVEKVYNTNAYQKTSSTLKTAGTKTSSAFSSIASFTTRKLSETRNSNSFKSFEEKMSSTYTNVKHSRSMGNIRGRMTKVRGSQSEQNFEDVLREEGTGDMRASASVPATPADEQLPL